MEFQINKIFRQFNKPGKMLEYEPIKSGHINHTYFVGTDCGDAYILQRINHQVFKDPEGVVANKIAVARHVAEKRSHLPPEDRRRRVLSFFRTNHGPYLLKDKDGDYWNLMSFIEESRVYLRTPNRKVAFEAGKAFGGFLRDTEDLDPSTLVDTIPRFHSMSLRYEQFDEALQKANSKRTKQAEELVAFANGLREEMQSLEKRVIAGEIPLRVTHNDTKISNALFSEDDEALCVIDLDTVMQGVVHFDFGDAVRTICNTGDEDEQDIVKVGFEMDYFQAFVEGFLGESGLVLTENEIEGLAFSSKVMTFIVGLRMLTDFLNNDVYFDTAYDLHNLVRARSQFRLAELIGERLEEMDAIVRTAARRSSAAESAEKSF